jgi:hypothetical protein
MTAKQKAARANFKKAVTDAQKLRKINPKLTQAQALKQAFAANKKVGAVKKKSAPKKKAAPKKAESKKAAPKKAALKKAAPKKVASKRITDIHKDSKSHNVNIRVVSGMDYNDPKYLFDEILFWQNQLDKLRAEYRSPKRKMYKKSIMDDIKLSKKWLENYKKKLRLHLNKVV